MDKFLKFSEILNHLVFTFWQLLTLKGDDRVDISYWTIWKNCDNRSETVHFRLLQSTFSHWRPILYERPSTFEKLKVGTYVNNLRLKADGNVNRIGRSWKMWTDINETGRPFDSKLFVFQIIQLIYDCPILVVWIVQFTFAHEVLHSSVGSRRWNWKFREKAWEKQDTELLLHSSYSFWPLLREKLSKSQPLPLVDS